MARSKKPYMVFQTKEEFEKFYKVFEEQLKQEFKHGVQAGQEKALSYFLQMLKDRFDEQTVNNANMMSEKRILKEWQEARERDELIKKGAVESYLNSEES